MNLVILLAECRQHDERQILVILLNAPDSFKAVHLRHHDIHQNDVYRLRGTGLDRFQTIGRLQDSEAVKLRIFADQLADLFLIITNQNNCHTYLIFALKRHRWQRSQEPEYLPSFLHRPPVHIPGA